MPESPDDAAALARHAEALADAIQAALPGWVLRCVVQRCHDAGGEPGQDVLAAARAAGERCAVEVGGQVRDLLRVDIDDQVTTPLGCLRSAVRYPTEVLQSAGVPPVRRDEFAERTFPTDVYDLGPATFADVDPSLHEPGLVWGAAKAHVHLARRRG